MGFNPCIERIIRMASLTLAGRGFVSLPLQGFCTDLLDVLSRMRVVTLMQRHFSSSPIGQAFPIGQALKFKLVITGFKPVKSSSKGLGDIEENLVEGSFPSRKENKEISAKQGRFPRGIVDYLGM